MFCGKTQLFAKESELAGFLFVKQSYSERLLTIASISTSEIQSFPGFFLDKAELFYPIPHRDRRKQR